MTTIDEDQLLAFVDTLPAFRSSVQHLLQLAVDINAAEFIPDAYKQLLHIASEQNLPLYQVETDMLGLNYSQAGNLLAEYRGLAVDLNGIKTEALAFID